MRTRFMAGLGAVDTLGRPLDAESQAWLDAHPTSGAATSSAPASGGPSFLDVLSTVGTKAADAFKDLTASQTAQANARTQQLLLKQQILNQRAAKGGGGTNWLLVVGVAAVVVVGVAAIAGRRRR